MIVNLKTKRYETRSDMPNSNWRDGEWYTLPDNSGLAKKIQRLYPRFEFVLDENGNLVDVVEIPKTQEEVNNERVEEIKTQLETLDKTVDRQWEDYYIREKVTPVNRIQVVITEKERLREELKSLIGGN